MIYADRDFWRAYAAWCLDPEAQRRASAARAARSCQRIVEVMSRFAMSAARASAAMSELSAAYYRIEEIG